MQVEETQVPPPIAKHGAWMIVNRKSKGSERGPAKSKDKKRWDSNHNLTIHSNGTNTARRVGRTVDSGRAAVNAATQVPTTTKHAGKGKQVDTIPIANTFAYLQDLENLQETPVLLEADTVSRGASKSRNHRKNNKGKKQTMVTQGTSSAITRIFSNGTSAVDQLFVFGNTTGAPPNPPSVNISDNLAHAKVSDFNLPNRSWDFDRLQDILPSEEVDKIRAIPIPLDEQGPDALYWPNSPGGAFSRKTNYSQTRHGLGGNSRMIVAAWHAEILVKTHAIFSSTATLQGFAGGYRKLRTLFIMGLRQHSRIGSIRIVLRLTSSMCRRSTTATPPWKEGPPLVSRADTAFNSRQCHQLAFDSYCRRTPKLNRKNRNFNSRRSTTATGTTATIIRHVTTFAHRYLLNNRKHLAPEDRRSSDPRGLQIPGRLAARNESEPGTGNGTENSYAIVEAIIDERRAKPEAKGKALKTKLEPAPSSARAPLQLHSILNVSPPSPSSSKQILQIASSSGISSPVSSVPPADEGLSESGAFGMIRIVFSPSGVISVAPQISRGLFTDDISLSELGLGGNSARVVLGPKTSNAVSVDDLADRLLPKSSNLPDRPPPKPPLDRPPPKPPLDLPPPKPPPDRPPPKPPLDRPEPDPPPKRPPPMPLLEPK
nr:uncharacterized protein LOC109157030 [Ipomoea batatas]